MKITKNILIVACLLLMAMPIFASTPELQPEAKFDLLIAAKHHDPKLPPRHSDLKPVPQVEKRPAPHGHGRGLNLDPRARQRLSGWLSRNGSVSVVMKTRDGVNIKTLTARRVKRGNYYRMRNVPSGTQFTVPNGWRIACVSGHVEGLGSSGKHTREGYVVYTGGQRVLLKNGASDLRIYP